MSSYPYGKLPYKDRYDEFVKKLDQNGVIGQTGLNNFFSAMGIPPSNQFGRTQSEKPPEVYRTPAETIDWMAQEGSGSGIPIQFPQTQNLPTTISTVQIPTVPVATHSSTVEQPQAQTQVQTPPEPLTTNQVVDNATLGTTMNPDIYALARLASGDINDKNQWYVNQIAAAKNLWNQAQTDADKKAAADYATHIRNLAEMRNIGLGAFGDGNNLTTEQANLAWGNYVLDEAEKYQNKFQAVQDNLKNNYGENSNDHFWRLYDEYRQNGDSDRTAAIKAGRETRVYQQDLVENLNSAISEYGIDGDVMNQFGLNNLARLAGEGEYGSNAANVYANSFTTPKRNAEMQQEMARAVMGNQSAMDKLLVQIRAQQANTQYQVEHQDARAAQGRQTQIDVANINQGGAAERQKKLFEQQKFLAEYNAEVQANLKILENSLKAEGGGDVTKTGDYKVAKDSYDRAYTRYNDLLKLLNKDTSMLNENELKKLQSDLAEAEEQMLQAGENIEAIAKKYNISQQPTVELPELPENYEEAREIIRQLKATKQYDDDQLREYIRQSRKFGGMDIDRLINDQPNTMH